MLTVRGGYSAYADPILRRAVVGQKSENADDTENYAIHPSRRRRIRDQKALYSHYNPIYGKPGPREDVDQQRAPHTFQNDVGGYNEQMEPRGRYDHPNAFVPARHQAQHDPLLNCGPPTPNQGWYRADQQSQASGFSPPRSFHFDNQTQVTQSGPIHPSRIQPFQEHPNIVNPQGFDPFQRRQDFQDFASFDDQGSREFGAREQRQHIFAAREGYPQADTAFADPRHFDDQDIYQQGSITPIVDQQGFDQQGLTTPTPQYFDDQKNVQQARFTTSAFQHIDGQGIDQHPFTTSTYQGYDGQGTYRQDFTAPSRLVHDAGSRIDPFRHTDASSLVDAFPDDTFNEDSPDPFFPEQAVGSFLHDEALESFFGESVDYGVEPEIPEDKPIPQVVTILPNTGIARFQRSSATEATMASSNQADQSFLFEDDDNKPQARGLMPPPTNRSYQQAKASSEYHDDQENVIVREFRTWKGDPAIRFFNEKVEVDAENRPLSRPGSPVFNDDLNLLGKKSLWE
jgi:hypothetical protein